MTCSLALDIGVHHRRESPGAGGVLTESVEGAHEATRGGLVIEATLLVVTVHRGCEGVLFELPTQHINLDPREPRSRSWSQSRTRSCAVAVARGIM